MAISFPSRDLPAQQFREHILEGFCKFYGMPLTGIHRISISVDADDCCVILHSGTAFPKQSSTPKPE